MEKENKNQKLNILFKFCLNQLIYYCFYNFQCAKIFISVVSFFFFFVLHFKKTKKNKKKNKLKQFLISIKTVKIEKKTLTKQKAFYFVL